MSDKEKELKRIYVSQIIKDLKSGVTRWQKHDLGYGSIEKKYNLTFAEMKQVLAHPKIHRVRVVIPSLILVDDVEEPTQPEETSSRIEVGDIVIREEIENKVKHEEPFI